MPQKVIKVGTSAAVTIPKALMDKLHIHVGDEVHVTSGPKRGSFVVTVTGRQVDKKLVDWTEKFIDRYRPALEALAKK